MRPSSQINSPIRVRNIALLSDSLIILSTAGPLAHKFTSLPCDAKPLAEDLIEQLRHMYKSDIYNLPN
jgi:hypothetical protein